MTLTTLVKQAFAVSMLSMLLVAPVFAQTEATTTAESAAPTITEADSSWFSVEKISGDINVGDFVVGPGRAEVQLNPGQSYTLEITVTNRISDNREFRLDIEDIEGSADGSSAVSLTGERVGPYSIRDFIVFPEDSFELALGERARIPVRVNVPQNAAPGGYYGSILVSTVQVSEATTGQVPRSPIVARVGSLVFLTVGGDIVRDGETLGITNLDNKLFYQSGPIDFAILFENKGSVHTNAYGELSITNMFGEEVGFVELEPWFILPKSLRSREISWNREALFGRYVATARINRGYDDIIDEVDTVFWVLPWKVMAVSFGVLFLIVFLIRFILKNFEFKRKAD